MENGSALSAQDQSEGPAWWGQTIPGRAADWGGPGLRTEGLHRRLALALPGAGRSAKPCVVPFAARGCRDTCSHPIEAGLLPSGVGAGVKRAS